MVPEVVAGLNVRPGGLYVTFTRGSHGSLRAEDSLGTLLTVGLDGKRPEREQWAISDVAGLVDGHFGIGAERSDAAAVASAAR